MNERTKIEEVLHVFAYRIEQECESFAISQMLEADFILLSDANFKKTADVAIQKGTERKLHTIKDSSKDKYYDFYNQKLENIVEKFIKYNAK